MWSAPGLPDGEPAPLLVVHDGPEYATLGDLITFLATGTAAGTLPPLRAALLGPLERNAWYSANPAYADALATRLLPVLPPATARIGVGVSLGALAMLHAHRRIGLDGLFLQSGSFFTAQYDPQERGFDGFAAVSSFVARLHDASGDRHPVPTVLTCGLVEENLANNRAMAATLGRLGYGTRLVEVRDAHNFTAWRDALDPHLPELLSRAVARRAA
ncbi:MAG: enterochelin esterase [Jatrophihabitans sp.]|nr:MAG: enterochelin esterase [Jatrophihabitans sp.]